MQPHLRYPISYHYCKYAGHELVTE